MWLRSLLHLLLLNFQGFSQAFRQTQLMVSHRQNSPQCFCAILLLTAFVRQWQWNMYTNAGDNVYMHTKTGLAKSKKLQMFQLGQFDRSFWFLLQCLQSKPHLKHFWEKRQRHSYEVTWSVFTNISKNGLSIKVLHKNLRFCASLLTIRGKLWLHKSQCCHAHTPKNTNIIIT